MRDVSIVAGLLTVGQLESALNSRSPTSQSACRRSEPRFELCGQVLVREVMEGSAAVSHRAELRNVSGHGIGLISPKELLPGTSTLLGLRHDTDVVWFLSIVRRTIRLPSGMFAHGLRYWGKLEHSVAEAVISGEPECIRGVQALALSIAESDRLVPIAQAFDRNKAVA